MVFPDRLDDADAAVSLDDLPRPPNVARRRLPQWSILSLLACVEAGALTIILRYGENAVVLIAALHIGILALTAGIIARAQQQGEDVTFLIIGLFGGAVVGPFGFLGAAALSWRPVRLDSSSPLVAQWYERIALSTSVPPEEQLYENVEVGRTLDLTGPLPESFPAAMITGSLVKRQAILGQIARHFDLAYLPTLKIALASPEPTIRVQAAAVASHIGLRMRRALHDCINAASRAPSDPLEALALLDDLVSLLDSGLLDATERQTSEALCQRLAETVISSLTGGPLITASVSDAARGIRLQERLEQLLIERGLFARLRAQRTVTRLLKHHPNARFRRLTPAMYTSEAS
ncbi:MAG: hypothetical protein AB7E81_16160 [Hyphomicrobiaceae bacterium]